MRALALGIVFVVFQLSAGAKVTDEPKRYIAGVPIYDMEEDDGSVSVFSPDTERTWIVMLKPTKNNFTVHSLCDWDSSGVPCNGLAEPGGSGISFASISANDEKLEKYAKSHGTHIKYIEPDFAVSIPPEELHPHEEDFDNVKGVAISPEELSPQEPEFIQQPELESSRYYVIGMTSSNQVKGWGPLPHMEADDLYNAQMGNYPQLIMTRTTKLSMSKCQGSCSSVPEPIRNWFNCKKDGDDDCESAAPSPPGPSKPAGEMWNLDRVDERQGFDGTYEPGKLDGSGVHVYVVDSGIRTTHEQFGGRAIPCADSFPGQWKKCEPTDNTCSQDDAGHGTHCAGTVAGKTMGAAPGAKVYSLKVFPKSGTVRSAEGIYAAMKWVAENANKPAVMSMSLGGPTSNTYKDLIDLAHNNGVLTVVAAGNNGGDACNKGPAFAPKAVTVGSMMKGDARSIFTYGSSNYGSCIDIFAPGSDIKSSYAGNDQDYKLLNGTSMACPLVSGIAALHLQKDPGLSPQALWAKLEADSTKDIISDPKGSANKMLYWPSPPSSGRRRRRSKEEGRRRRRSKEEGRRRRRSSRRRRSRRRRRSSSRRRRRSKPSSRRRRRSKESSRRRRRSKTRRRRR